jgi:predicted ATP-grasp superfamily ATP-dependent carboligase
MNKVVVIGGDHHNTLGVIRGLGERGILSDLILVTPSRMTFVNASKYVKRWWKIDNDCLTVDLLLKEYKKEEEKPVIFCSSDSSSSIIDSNRNKLSPYFLLPGAGDQGHITHLMSKKNMSNLALEVGFQIPKTCYGDKIGIEPAVPLPCILKPIVSAKGSKTDIHICYKWQDVINYVEVIGRDNVQIQQFIDKDFEYQLIGCSTKSEVIIPGVSKILRPCKGSNTSFLHYEPLVEGFCEIEKCKEFVRRTGYRGLFSLEFLRDKQGNDYFMEINFRNDGNAICVTASGMSLPYIWYLDSIGKDYSEESNKLIHPVYVMPDIAEFKLLVTGQISPSQYIGDLKKTNRFMEYDSRDKKPFWKLIKFHICSRLGI